MPKEQKIYDNDTGCHYQNAKHHIGIPWHFKHPLKYVSSRLSMKLLGFLMLAVRDEAVSQILGLLVLENGIFLGSQILVPGMPMLIEIVILFDLLIIVACFGMLIRYLLVHAGTTSSRQLNRLVG